MPKKPNKQKQNRRAPSEKQLAWLETLAIARGRRLAHTHIAPQHLAEGVIARPKTAEEASTIITVYERALGWDKLRTRRGHWPHGLRVRLTEAEAERRRAA